MLLIGKLSVTLIGKFVIEEKEKKLSTIRRYLYNENNQKRQKESKFPRRSKCNNFTREPISLF